MKRLRHGRSKRRFSKLTDRHIEAITEFSDDPVTGLPGGPINVWDGRSMV
jgi:hypothetical protein